ncbi:MAG: 2-phospho-L-lactate transferase [Rhodobacteraceae bacterium]|nr:2-phospho-L-lactate transferase [Paracoccaceae bacterium]
MSDRLRVTLLAGGVGGAKLAEGFAALKTVSLTVIGNVADDDVFHGLWVSPDIDTMLYTLGGRINREQGWGVADEGRRALTVLQELGADTWMFLGDRDLGLHIYRTERLQKGDRPSLIVRDIAERFGIAAQILLPTDDRVQTRVRTGDGWLAFQEYFVRERCTPRVLELRYQGIGSAKPSPEAIAAIAAADLVVIAPSNPLVSIAPILGIDGITEAICATRAPVLAVSPLIAGQAIRGPASAMMDTLGLQPDVKGVAGIYAGIAGSLMIDHQDARHADAIRTLGLAPVCSDILMPDRAGKVRLASAILDLLPSQAEPGNP